MKKFIIKKPDGKKEEFNKWSELPPREGEYEQCKLQEVTVRDVPQYGGKK